MSHRAYPSTELGAAAKRSIDIIRKKKPTRAVELRLMLAAELRYVGSFLAALAVFLAAGVCALIVGIAAHLSPSLSAALFMFLLALFGFIALVVWLPQVGVTGTVPSTPARYAPRIVTIAILLVCAFSIVTAVAKLNATHWKAGVDSFSLSCILTGNFAAATFAEWRRTRTYRDGRPGPISKHAQRRLAQLQAAYELPTIAEQRQALRPIHRRGFARLVLLALGIVLLTALEPVAGVLPAYLVSVGSVGVTFLILHRLIDL